MGWWRKVRNWLSVPHRMGAGNRLVIIPGVSIGLAPYAVLAVFYVLVDSQSGQFATVAWVDMFSRLVVALMAPCGLFIAWRYSKPLRRVLPVYDWIGGGMIALSVAWLAVAIHELVERVDIGWLARVLLSYGPALVGMVGTGLMICGMIALSGAFVSEQRERQRLEALMDFTRRVPSLDGQATLDVAVRQLYQLLEAKACVLFLWREADQVLAPVAGLHDQQTYSQDYVCRMMSFNCPAGYGLTGWVFATGIPYISGDVKLESRAQAVPGWPAEEESCLLAPLEVEGRRLGVVRLVRPGLHRFTPEDMDLAMSFAGQVALVIEHSRVARELSGRSQKPA